MTNQVPEEGDIIHDTIENELYEVTAAFAGLELADAIEEANDEGLQLPERKPADYLTRMDEVEGAAQLMAGGFVEPVDGADNQGRLLLRWIPAVGLRDARFVLFDGELE